MFENWTNWFKDLAKCEKCKAPMMVSSDPDDPWQYNNKTCRWEHDCEKAQYREPITKLKVIENYGCSRHDITFNGKDLSELSKLDKQEMAEYLLGKLRKELLNGDIELMSVVNLFEYDRDIVGDDCDQCGSSFTVTTWKI